MFERGNRYLGPANCCHAEDRPPCFKRNQTPHLFCELSQLWNMATNLEFKKCQCGPNKTPLWNRSSPWVSSLAPLVNWVKGWVLPGPEARERLICWTRPACYYHPVRIWATRCLKFRILGIYVRFRARIWLICHKPRWNDTRKVTPRK